MVFFFKQKTADEMGLGLEFRRVLFRSAELSPENLRRRARVLMEAGMRRPLAWKEELCLA
mgnify:CR=1 FL=1